MRQALPTHSDFLSESHRPTVGASKKMVDIECCNTEQIVLIVAYPVIAVLCIPVWYASFFKPLKLFAVLIHETGHAVAVKLTCGTLGERYRVARCGQEGGLTIYSL